MPRPADASSGPELRARVSGGLGRAPAASISPTAAEHRQEHAGGGASEGRRSISRSIRRASGASESSGQAAEHRSLSRAAETREHQHCGGAEAAAQRRQA